MGSLQVSCTGTMWLALVSETFSFRLRCCTTPTSAKDTTCRQFTNTSLASYHDMCPTMALEKFCDDGRPNTVVLDDNPACVAKCRMLGKTLYRTEYCHCRGSSPSGSSHRWFMAPLPGRIPGACQADETKEGGEGQGMLDKYPFTSCVHQYCYCYCYRY